MQFSTGRSKSNQIKGDMMNTNSKVLNVGDVVTLMSGGALMTVYYISAHQIQDTIKCAWFDKENHIHYENLRPEVLVKYVNPDELED